MLLKFLLGIAMVAFTTFCAYLLAEKFRQRKLFFSQLKEFNERFLNEITYYRRPIAVFASEYSYEGEFHQVLLSFFHAIDERSPAERFFLDEKEFSFLSPDERIFIENYFQMLGKGDTLSQKGYFSSVKDSIGKLQNSTESECKK